MRGEKKKGAQEEEFELSRREERRGKRAVKKRCARARAGRAYVEGLREGVNKVRRAVARTTTNPELGLEPSRRPTHPSFAPSVFFPCIPLSDSLNLRVMSALHVSAV